MDKEQINKFDELYRIVDITAKARYRASTRLNSHGIFSQWTLSLLAIGLIISSALSISGMQLNFSEKYTSVMQLIFSVIVLTYSLLLGMGNFSARAERFHRCGLELSRLVRKVKPFKGKDGNDQEYASISKEYYDHLEKYENHKDVDFLSARIEIERRKGYPDWNTNYSFFKNTSNYFAYMQSRFSLWSSIRIRQSISFSHYALSLLLVYGWIFLDVHKP
ncbi:MAG TPA: SLATT domain-containing protein [Cellvibrionaceae bacterium]